MKATLTFQNNKQANDFALAYSRKTLKGHVVGNNTVTVYNVNEETKIFIDEYVKNLNK
tara:strand:+ start:43 stop:216 length:174 start_codon:yes stop_codon:yes gene_type:complete